MPTEPFAAAPSAEPQPVLAFQGDDDTDDALGYEAALPFLTWAGLASDESGDGCRRAI